MTFYSRIGFAYRTQAEVVGPPNHPLVKFLDHFRSIQVDRLASSFVADRLTDALHSLLVRDGAQIGSPRLHRVAATKPITQKYELLLRQLCDPCLGFVHR